MVSVYIVYNEATPEAAPTCICATEELAEEAIKRCGVGYFSLRYMLITSQETLDLALHCHEG